MSMPVVLMLHMNRQVHPRMRDRNRHPLLHRHRNNGHARQLNDMPTASTCNTSCRSTASGTSRCCCCCSASTTGTYACTSANANSVPVWVGMRMHEMMCMSVSMRIPRPLIPNNIHTQPLSPSRTTLTQTRTRTRGETRARILQRLHRRLIDHTLRKLQLPEHAPVRLPQPQPRRREYRVRAGVCGGVGIGTVSHGGTASDSGEVRGEVDFLEPETLQVREEEVFAIDRVGRSLCRWAPSIRVGCKGRES